MALRLRRQALLLLVAVFVLCPALVLSSGTRADALAGPVTVPVAALDALGLSGGEAGVATAGRLALIANPYGLTISAVLLGAGLYATRDSWLPYVTGAFQQDGGQANQPSDNTVASCNGYTSWSTLPTTTDNAGAVLFAGRPANSCGAIDTGNVQFNMTSTYTCQVTSTGAKFVQSQAVTPIIRTTGNTYGVGNCGPVAHFVDVIVKQTPGSPNPIAGLSWTTGGTLADATLTTTVQCVNAAGDTASVTLTSAANRGFPMPSCEARLGDGWHGTGITTTGGSSTNPGTVLKAAPDATSYAKCVGPDKACRLAVFVDGTICTLSRSACWSWPTLVATSPTRVSCKWGPYTLAIADCSVLERSYLPDPQPCTTTASCDGDPATDPVPTPTTTPTTTTSPSPTSSSTTGTDPLPTGSPPVETSPPPESTPTENSDCWPSGWGLLNPASWVLRPTKCALRWAFVPAQGVVAGQIDGMKADANGTAPGQWVAAISGLGPGMHVQEAGCRGPAVTWSPAGTFYPFDACSPPMSYVAATCHLLLQVGVCLGGAFGCVRALGSGFGWNPGVGGGAQ